MADDSFLTPPEAHSVPMPPSFQACRAVSVRRRRSLVGSLLTPLFILVSVVACGRSEPAFQPAVTGGSDVTADTGVGADTSEPGDVGAADAGPSDSGAPDSNSGAPDSSVADTTGGDATNSDTGADTNQPDATETTNSTGPVVVGTWNLHNFSVYGVDEWRLDDMVAKVGSLDFDVLAVQELKVKEGSGGEGPQAFTELVDRLPEHAGLNAPWDDVDSTVGLIYRTDTTTIHDVDVLYETDWSAFPRPPLAVDLTVARAGGETRMTVVVLHLKAFKDSVDRRRDACAKLVTWVEQHPSEEFLIIGDFNDDPYDAPADNSFVDTFLDAEPDFHFLTAILPPETVTSTGYYHYVDGQKITGEFLDHAVMTGGLFASLSNVSVTVGSVPESQYSTWKSDYSDHFPVFVTLTP